MTFGEAITKARKGRQMLQKDVAARILKQDGEAISASYLNDIEHSRRHSPNGEVIQQLADMLDLDADYLFFLAGRVPTDLLGLPADPESSFERWRLCGVLWSRELGAI